MSIEAGRVSRFKWQNLLQWSGLYLVGAAVLGVLGAVFWVLVVDLPGYVVQADGHAVTSERDLTSVFNSDAWFAAIGVVLGLGLGFIAWRWFRHLGWPMVALATAGALTAGVVCWLLGVLLGPGSFQDRLAQAAPGDFVPISLELRSPVVLALWVMMAVLPVLIGASLARDPDDAPLHRRQPFPVAPSPASAASAGSAPSEPSVPSAVAPSAASAYEPGPAGHPEQSQPTATPVFERGVAESPDRAQPHQGGA